MATPYVQRVNRWIERVFNARGGSPVVSDVDSSIHVDYDFASGVEDRYLQGWNRFGAAGVIVAVAAQTSSMQIRNPTGSNVIAILERITFHSGAATISQFNISQAARTVDYGSLITPMRLDPRGNPGSAMVVSSTANGSTFNTVLALNGNNSTNFEGILTQNGEFVLVPGDCVAVTDQTANETLVCSFLWRERGLEPSELV